MASLIINKSDNSETKKCPTCNDLLLDSIGNWGHRKIPFANLTSSAKSGCSTCSMLLEGILTKEDDPQDIEKVVLLSLGKLQPLNVNLWTIEGLKLELEFYLDSETEDGNSTSVDESHEESEPSAWPVIGKARHISTDSSSEGCFDLALNWLGDCFLNHKNCSGYFEQSLPTRVLEISSDDYVTLVEPPSYEKDHYVALSHCWGSVMPIRTTKANYEKMKDEGILISELPKTFRDAIGIADKLNVSYIWIDSLCIIQDCEVDWAIEAEKMSGVYSNATFTIAAHASEDSNGGCFVRDLDRQNEFATIRGLNRDGVESEIHIRLAGFREPGRDEGLAHIVKGNRNNPAPSRLSTRGWVFQERLLAQRTLHFTGSELVFECRSGLQCECRVGIDTSEHATNFKRKFIEDSIEDSIDVEGGREKPMINILPNFVPRWLDLVEHYTNLQLTQQSDRLPALSGLAQTNWEDIYHASKTETPAYIFGLWKKTFLRDLHWRSSRRLVSDTIPTHTRHEKTYAPSWSWASVIGPIEYEKEIKENGFEKNRWFEILEIHADLTTKNKFGPGKGYFLAKSLILRCKVIVTEGSDVTRYIIASKTVLKGDKGSAYEFFERDIDGGEEVSDGRECWLMITGMVKEGEHVLGIVLVEVEDAFMRVGYLRGRNFTMKQWQEGSELKGLKVV